MAFLSLIIPVYKVEKYLSQCINSVIDQHLDDFELILVDDGSPDRCPEICNEYKEKYDFIRVIHKPNGGLSSARNAGIAAAMGMYIMFMDSDDRWNTDVNMHEVLAAVKKQPEVDMFLLTSLDYIEGGGYYKRAEHERLSAVRTDCVAHYYEDLLKNGNLEVSAATKIIKHSFIVQNNLFFKEGIVCEDSEWMIRLLRVLCSVSVINQPLYIYRMGRVDSITNTIGKRNLEDMLEIIEASIDYYSDISASSDKKVNEFCYCAYMWFCALGLTCSLTSEEYSEIKPLLEKTSVVCEYSNFPKTKASYFVYNLFGIGISRLMFGAYLKSKYIFKLNKKKQDIK